MCVFKGYTCGIWKFPGLGSNWNCSCWPTPQLQECGIWALSVTYITAHSNTGSLTHWVRPGIEPRSSRMLVRFASVEPWWELPRCYKIIWIHRNASLHHNSYSCKCVFLPWPSNTTNVLFCKNMKYIFQYFLLFWFSIIPFPLCFHPEEPVPDWMKIRFSFYECISFLIEDADWFTFDQILLYWNSEIDHFSMIKSFL